MKYLLLQDNFFFTLNHGAGFYKIISQPCLNIHTHPFQKNNTNDSDRLEFPTDFYPMLSAKWIGCEKWFADQVFKPTTSSTLTTRPQISSIISVGFFSWMFHLKIYFTVILSESISSQIVSNWCLIICGFKFIIYFATLQIPSGLMWRRRTARWLAKMRDVPENSFGTTATRSTLKCSTFSFLSPSRTRLELKNVLQGFHLFWIQGVGLRKFGVDVYNLLEFVFKFCENFESWSKIFKYVFFSIWRGLLLAFMNNFRVSH